MTFSGALFISVSATKDPAVTKKKDKLIRSKKTKRRMNKFFFSLLKFQYIKIHYIKRCVHLLTVCEKINTCINIQITKYPKKQK